MSEDCKTCKKWDKKKKRCMVLKETMANCWAYTGNPRWQKEVRKAVEEYKKNREERA